MDTKTRGYTSPLEQFNGLCCIKGCDLAEIASGLCNKHWRRLKNNGSPIWLRRPAGAFRGIPTIERFFYRVTKTEGCWNWNGPTDQDGYGIFRGDVLAATYFRAHRFSWAFHHEKTIPRQMGVCHSCDNPRCVKPDHLELGTSAENQADKWRKGRGKVLFGINHWAAKITEADVKEIRNSTKPQDQLAKQYGVTQGTISDIRRRKSWRHIA